jgi:hypothetical protein
MTATLPKIVWTKRHWKLKSNPFPSEAIARLGGNDRRENGLLFDPNVLLEKVEEAAEKFVLGAAYSGLRFGYLWSLGVGLEGDARGFGKSSLMQYLVERVNEDFGRRVFLDTGLEEEDADEHPLCAVLASFDMANARSLNAVFYEAARYACRFRRDDDSPTLAERLREELVKIAGTDVTEQLVSAIAKEQEELRGRTLGPPVEEFLQLLCTGDSQKLAQFVDNVTPTKRARSGATYLATLLIMAKAAGIKHVLLCCDQLEDFASTTTSRQKRTLETERFRDYILELQPMCDMLSCVVTMHPRATQAIGDAWRLADLPSYDHDREENRHRVVILKSLDDVARVKDLLSSYLNAYRTEEPPQGEPLHPFTDAAVEALHARSGGKPRDILRKANALVETGAEENWQVIDAKRAIGVLDSLAADDTTAYDVPSSDAVPTRSDLWNE